MSFNTTRPANELESPQPSAIPGAYPTDDMSGNFAAADSTGSQRNKLHKPNDPRGWDQDQTSRVHQSTDSGIGMPQSNAASGAPDNTYQGSQLGHNPLGSSNDRYDGLAGAPTSGLGETGQFQRQQAHPGGVSDHNSPFSEANNKDSTMIQSGTGAGPGSALSKPGEEGSKTTTDDPYWGDLPRGAGVYNTVIGHGSTEDDQAHSHRDSEHAPTGANTSTYGANQQREFPLTGQSQTTHGYGTENNRDQSRNLNDRKDDDRRKGLYEAGGAAALASTAHHTSRDDTRQQSRDLNDPKDDDRRKGLYEAGGVAAVGSAAYPITRSHEQEKQDKHDKHAEKAREAKQKQPEEKKESKIHALFHRDSSGKDDKPKEKKEHVCHEKQTETVVPAATRRVHDEQPQAQDYSRNAEQFQFRDNRQKDIDSKDSKVKEGLGLGAAGAAAYGATRYAEREHDKPDATSSLSSNKPADYRQTENFSSSQQPITNDYGNRSAADSKYNALPSGTASGVKQDNIGGNDNTLASNSRAQSSTSHTARDATAATAASAAVIGSQYDRSSHPSSTAAEKRDAYPTEHREKQYTSRSVFDTRDAKPTGRSEQPYEPYKEQHYEPSREQQYSKPTERSEQQYQPFQEQQYTKSSMAEDVPKQSKNREAAALGGGAAAATGAAAFAYKSHASPSERADTTHDKSTTSPMHKKPGSSTESDQYNHLASGTPSGINLEH